MSDQEQGQVETGLDEAASRLAENLARMARRQALEALAPVIEAVDYLLENSLFGDSEDGEARIVELRQRVQGLLKPQG